MAVYARFIQCFAIFNLLACTCFSVYGYIRPKQIIAGTMQNSLGFFVGALGFFLMLVLAAIFFFKLGQNSVNNLIKFNVANVIPYGIFIFNAIYRLFIGSHFDSESNLSTTSGKLMATLALALILNLTALIVSTNYLKAK